MVPSFNEGWVGIAVYVSKLFGLEEAVLSLMSTTMPGGDFFILYSSDQFSCHSFFFFLATLNHPSFAPWKAMKCKELFVGSLKKNWGVSTMLQEIKSDILCKVL